MKAKRYAAFLRGINVGGNSLVKMSDLKKSLESLGLINVQTILASGNVVFDAPKASVESSLRSAIEKKLEADFGFRIMTQVRSMESLQKIIESDPFKGIKVTKDTRLYVTLLSEAPLKPLKLPYSSEGGSFRILKHSTKTDLYSVLELDGNSRTIDLMSIVEKSYGKNVTTRNWNTLLKIAAKADTEQ